MKRRLLLLIMLIALPAVLSYCSRVDASVQLNGKTLTESDLKSIAPKRYQELRNWYAQNVSGLLKDAAQKQMVELEAKSQGMEPKQYMDSIMKKVARPSDAEVEKKYLELKTSGLLGGRSLSEVKPVISRQLYVESVQTARNNDLYRLAKKYNFKYKHGFARKGKVDIAGDPTTSTADAKITVVEFTDFKCGYCARARGTSKQLIAKYGDKIRWVIKDSPFQRGAMDVHKAVNCMHRVNKDAYWKYFETLFSPFRGRETLQEPALTNIAVRLGANRSKFRGCLKDPAIDKEIQGDLAQGRSLGVRGTPAFFINGVFVDGARPFMDFVNVIEGELN